MAEKRFLISIGIDDYELSPLDFCAKDARDITQAMNAFCNVDSKSIYPITSEEYRPNRRIFEAFEQVMKRIESKFIQGEDSIFFYFSGHGTKSDNSTRLVFNDKLLELNELFSIFMSLKPKFIFCLIDACYSGVGIDDGIGKSQTESQFFQHLKLVDGYNIICACAADSKAKEDENLQNGRMTRIFIDIISNNN